MSWQPGMTMDDVERVTIEAALRYHQNNKTQTAQALGIAIRTLDNKLQKYAQADQAAQVKADEVEQKRRDELARMRGPHSNGVVG